MVADDVEQGQFSFCFTEELREDTHGRLALSAMGTWGIAEVDRITILLRPASKRHAGSEPQFIRSPRPHALLVKFSNLNTLRLVGQNLSEDSEIARLFVEALINISNNSEPSKNPSRLVDLKLEHIPVTRSFQATPRSLQQTLARSGFSYWLNGSLGC